MSARIGPNDVENHAPWLRRLARELIADPVLADDLAQDTLVAALCRPPQVENPKAYLVGMLRNMHRMWLRTNVRRRRREQLSPCAPADRKTDDLLFAAEDLQRLRKHIHNVTEPYRTTLQLRYYDEMPNHEIARQLDILPATVRKRVQLGIRQLRAAMA